MNNNSISVVFADSSHAHYAQRICDLIYESALQRGTGIAKRSPEYIAAKMTGGKAVVALDGEKLIGFSYSECWDTAISSRPRGLSSTRSTAIWDSRSRSSDEHSSWPDDDSRTPSYSVLRRRCP